MTARIGRERVAERIFRSATFAAALLVLILLGGVVVALVVLAMRHLNKVANNGEQS